MSRILVTGGCGFIGSWIVKGLLEEGHWVVAIDDLSGGSTLNIDDIIGAKNFHFYQYSCTDEDAMNVALEVGKFDVVYHLAANAREGASFFQPLSIVKRNTLAYTNILMNSIKYGVKRIILFSSIAAYGNQESPFHEGMPLKPVDLYGLQKANMEEMTKLMAKCHDFEYIIFRPFNVYGPGQALNDPFRNVFGIWMNRIMKGETVQIYGDGSQQRAFSYIEDNIPCYLKALDCEPNQTFNIGSSQPNNLAHAAWLTIGAMGAEYVYEVESLPDRHGEVKIAYCDVTKVKEALGFEEKTSLADGLFKMAAWAKAQGPQEWREGDPIELPNSDKLPRNWRK